MPMPAPMHRGVPENLTADGERIAGNRAVCPDIGQRLPFQLRKPGKTGAEFPAAFPIGVKIRPVLRGPDRELLVRIVHQQPVLVQKLSQHGLLESFHAGLQRELRVLSANVHRVVLNAPCLPYIGIGAVFAGKTIAAEQSLLRQNEASRLVLCQHCHPFPLQRSGSVC